MKTIAVASRNPVKAQAALAGFRRIFPGEELRYEAVAAASGVAHQPTSSAETFRGALHRARVASNLVPGADFQVGIEGGVEDTAEGMTAFAWVVVLAGGRIGKGRTGTFFLPEAVADLVRGGKELGEADDIVFGRENSKQKEGAVGLLTNQVVDRTALYEHAVVLALVPFVHPELYGGSPGEGDQVVTSPDSKPSAKISSSP